MKHLLILLLTSLTAGAASDFHPRRAFTNSTASVAASCVNLIAQNVETDQYTVGTAVYSQRITLTGTICKVRLKTSAASGGNVTVKFYSAANEGGGQIGSTSSVVASDTGTYTTNEFSFSTNPVLTGDAYLHFYSTGADTKVRADVSDGNSYSNTTYCLYAGADPAAAGIVDLWFEVDTEQ